MSNGLPVLIPEAEVIEFCRRHQIQRLSLFGSVLRDDFSPESDIDVLVEFTPENTPGLIRLMTMQEELESLFGRKVDLLTPKFLHQRIRGRILNEARVLYDAA